MVPPVAKAGPAKQQRTPVSSTRFKKPKSSPKITKSVPRAQQVGGSSDGPPFLEVGHHVSAKFHGAYCEAVIVSTLRPMMKINVTLLDNKNDKAPKERSLDREDVQGMLRIGETVYAAEKGKFIKAKIQSVRDMCEYHIRYDDGDERVLKRHQVKTKGEKHYDSESTLDNLPLLNPDAAMSSLMSELFCTSRSATRQLKAIMNVEPTIMVPKEEEDQYSSLSELSDSDDDKLLTKIFTGLQQETQTEDEPIEEKLKRARKTEAEAFDAHRRRSSSRSPSPNPRIRHHEGKILVGKIKSSQTNKMVMCIGIAVTSHAYFTAEDTAKYIASDDCPVRCLPDGEYRTIAMKNLSEFDEKSLKVSDLTVPLKVAYDSVIRYKKTGEQSMLLAKLAGELPTGWTKASVFGRARVPKNWITEVRQRLRSTKKSSANTRRREKFYGRLEQHYKRIDYRPELWNPEKCERALDLCRLYFLVRSYGGFATVCEEFKWPLILKKLKLKENIDVVELRDIYHKRLETFEYWQSQEEPHSGRSRMSSGSSQRRSVQPEKRPTTAATPKPEKKPPKPPAEIKPSVVSSPTETRSSRKRNKDSVSARISPLSSGSESNDEERSAQTSRSSSASSSKKIVGTPLDVDDGFFVANILCKLKDEKNMYKACNRSAFYNARIVESFGPEEKLILRVLTKISAQMRKRNQKKLTDQLHLDALRELGRRKVTHVHYSGWNNRYDEWQPLYWLKVAAQVKDDGIAHYHNNYGFKRDFLEMIAQFYHQRRLTSALFDEFVRQRADEEDVKSKRTTSKSLDGDLTAVTEKLVYHKSGFKKVAVMEMVNKPTHLSAELQKFLFDDEGYSIPTPVKPEDPYALPTPTSRFQQAEDKEPRASKEAKKPKSTSEAPPSPKKIKPTERREKERQPTSPTKRSGLPDFWNDFSDISDDETPTASTSKSASPPKPIKTEVEISVKTEKKTEKEKSSHSKTSTSASKPEKSKEKDKKSSEPKEKEKERDKSAAKPPKPPKDSKPKEKEPKEGRVKSPEPPKDSKLPKPLPANSTPKKRRPEVERPTPEKRPKRSSNTVAETDAFPKPLFTPTQSEDISPEGAANWPLFRVESPRKRDAPMSPNTHRSRFSTADDINAAHFSFGEKFPQNPNVEEILKSLTVDLDADTPAVLDEYGQSNYPELELRRIPPAQWIFDYSALLKLASAMSLVRTLVRNQSNPDADRIFADAAELAQLAQLLGASESLEFAVDENQHRVMPFALQSQLIHYFCVKPLDLVEIRAIVTFLAKQMTKPGVEGEEIPQTIAYIVEGYAEFRSLFGASMADELLGRLMGNGKRGKSGDYAALLLNEKSQHSAFPKKLDSDRMWKMLSDSSGRQKSTKTRSSTHQQPVRPSNPDLFALFASASREVHEFTAAGRHRHPAPPLPSELTQTAVVNLYFGLSAFPPSHELESLRSFLFRTVYDSIPENVKDNMEREYLECLQKGIIDEEGNVLEKKAINEEEESVANTEGYVVPFILPSSWDPVVAPSCSSTNYRPDAELFCQTHKPLQPQADNSSMDVTVQLHGAEAAAEYVWPEKRAVALVATATPKQCDDCRRQPSSMLVNALNVLPLAVRSVLLDYMAKKKHKSEERKERPQLKLDGLTKAGQRQLVEKRRKEATLDALRDANTGTAIELDARFGAFEPLTDPPSIDDLCYSLGFDIMDESRLPKSRAVKAEMEKAFAELGVEESCNRAVESLKKAGVLTNDSHLDADSLDALRHRITVLADLSELSRVRLGFAQHQLKLTPTFEKHLNNTQSAIREEIRRIDAVRQRQSRLATQIRRKYPRFLRSKKPRGFVAIPPRRRRFFRAP